MTVTPWEVSGKVDYEKLVKEFGTKRIDGKLRGRLEKAAGGTHVMLHREFFFSHRDLDLVLDDYGKGKGFYLYTGRKPGGQMHLGHLIPMIFTKWLQDRFGVNLYIEITDDENFLYKKDMGWEETGKWAEENIAEIAAVGFDPDRTFIYRDSEYMGNTYPMLLKIAKKVTFSTVKAVFGFTNETNIGMGMYPACQMLPTFFEKKRCLIPAAIDQDPYWRIQRDIAEGLGYHKAAQIHSKFLSPLQGAHGKMSSSAKESGIWLDDDEKTVRGKIMKYAFSGGRSTLEEHRRLGADLSVDVPFQWLSVLFEPDDVELKRIAGEYGSGRMLTGEVKEILAQKINEFLAEHRARKERADVRRYMHTGKLAKEMWNKRFE
ncbi:MAG: tryptophan--tRNA ligase [Candidatus ainarchaeum sp.]|nr:tryptophan--tRNA ligase [Candidatus ainarchaeum sp.]